MHHTSNQSSHGPGNPRPKEENNGIERVVGTSCWKDMQTCTTSCGSKLSRTGICNLNNNDVDVEMYRNNQNHIVPDDTETLNKFTVYYVLLDFIPVKFHVCLYKC